MIRFFEAAFLIEELDLPYDDSIVKLDELKTRRRWTDERRLIFEYDNHFWEVTYENGLTEGTEVDPWPKDSKVRAVEVFPKTKIIEVVEWIRLPNEDTK